MKCRMFTRCLAPEVINLLNGVRYLLCRVIEVTLTIDVCTVSVFSHQTENVHFFLECVSSDAKKDTWRRK